MATATLTKEHIMATATLTKIQADLETAAEQHNSGQYPTAAARKRVAALVRKKLALTLPQAI